MILIEQIRQAVSRLGPNVEIVRQSSISSIGSLVDQILAAHWKISRFVAENRRSLSAGEIAPMKFGECEERGRDFKREWLASGRAVLPMLDMCPEISESSSALALKRLIGEVDQELREIDFHQRSMGAYLEKHPMPEAWLDPNFAAHHQRTGTDVRDYLAALQR